MSIGTSRHAGTDLNQVKSPIRPKSRSVGLGFLSWKSYLLSKGGVAR